MKDWLASLFRRATPGGPQASVDYSVITTPDGLEESLRGASETSSGAAVTAGRSLQVGAVYRCVDLRATALACLPIHVIAEQADGSVGQKVGSHPIARLLARPNRRHTGFEFRRLLSVHVLMRGNGYALKVRSGREIVELLPMHPDRVLVEELADQSLRYTYTRKDGRQVAFPAADILHLRDLSTDGIVGLSRLTMMREAVGMALQAEKFGARMFKNGIGAGGAIKHPSKLGDVAHARLKQDMSERYSGADNAHKWMVLEEGMDVVKLGMTSQDMQFIDSRRFQRSEIAMFFGVPPHLIGDVEKSTSWGTGIEQQNLGFLQYTLAGDVAMWEQSIERDIVGEAQAPSIYVKMNVTGFLRAASKDRAEYYARSLGAGGGPAWMTPNEVRALEDLPPLPGGDDLPQPPTSGTAAPPVVPDVAPSEVQPA